MFDRLTPLGQTLLVLVMALVMLVLAQNATVIYMAIYDFMGRFFSL